MNIKNSIALYTLVITVVPLLTILYFLNGFLMHERNLSSLSDGAIALKEFSVFKSTIKHWFVLGDLIIASSETYLADDGIQHGIIALEQLDYICQSPPAAKMLTQCSKLFIAISANNQRLKESLQIVNTPASNKVLTAYDNNGEIIIKMISDLAYVLIGQQRDNESLSKKKRADLIYYLLLAGCLNVLLVTFCWRYLYGFLVNPIEKLTASTSTTDDVSSTFKFAGSKPLEIDLLSKSINSFSSRLEKMALFDSLTGLPNRTYFEVELDKQISILERTHHQLAVLFIDLDNFKHINDTYGHEQGDKILVEFAKRISSCVRSSDTFARFGGDEFLLIAVDIRGREDVNKLIAKIFQSMEVPVQLEDTEWKLGTSIGISITDDQYIAKNQFIQQADKALYWVKHRGKGYSYYFQDIKKQVL